ncbi:MAG: hypothetical protein QXQ69_00505 [Candidatus Aenigmatarchaeota archaeon]
MLIKNLVKKNLRKKFPGIRFEDISKTHFDAEWKGYWFRVNVAKIYIDVFEGKKLKKAIDDFIKEIEIPAPYSKHRLKLIIFPTEYAGELLNKAILVNFNPYYLVTIALNLMDKGYFIYITHDLIKEWGIEPKKVVEDAFETTKIVVYK